MEQARSLGLVQIPALIDPVSVVARTAEVGEATVVNTSVTIGANTTLGFAVHVNRSASLGHDNVIADFATIGPRAALAGGVHIGRGAFLGVGAICAPDVRVGENAVVGAGAVVVKDVEPGAVVVGNPAHVVRISETGYGGVAVPC
jgi:acetyltransferase-like isoleucine patch superfamily enzyme